ncbi:RNA polymerase sigma factor [Comamonas serinivorans]|nr:RNA polymerase sigma factor [Comamonas serinivorans]
MSLPAAPPSDEALMLAYAQHGDLRAFETLYERLALPMWRYVLRSVGDRAMADDIAQDTWFNVVRAAASYQPTARFKTWLFTLAHNRLVDHLRAKRPQVSLSADTDEGLALANTLAVDSGFGPLQQVAHRQQAQALLDALAELPELQREAFLMQAEAGLSLAEIAEATGTSTETVKSRLRYARQKLRQSLEALA